DARVLPHLYPAMHTALGGVTLLAAAVGAVAFRVDARRTAPRVVIVVGLLLATGAVAWLIPASRRLRSATNLRLVLVERAPLLGRAVRAAGRVAPPLPNLEDDTATAAATPGE